MLLRHVTPSDRDALYDICRRTGASGGDGSDLVTHPEMFGDIWAGPYLEFESAFCSVLEDDEGVGGYVLGCLDTARFEERLDSEWWPSIRSKYADLRELATTSPAELRSWDAKLLDTIDQPPVADPELLHAFPSHLHIDLLPRLQHGGWGTVLIESLVQDLQAAGSPGVHLVAGADNERALRFYRRSGFTKHATGSTTSVTVTMSLVP